MAVSTLKYSVALLLLVVPFNAAFPAERVITTLTRGQIADNDGIYFNCDHEGKVGCLIVACKAKKFSKESAATVQYLYRDVASDFHDLLTARISRCFVKAGGRIILTN